MNLMLKNKIIFDEKKFIFNFTLTYLYVKIV